MREKSTMHWLISLFMVLVMSVSAMPAQAQSALDKPVKLNLTEATLSQFTAALTKQTGLNFFYSSQVAKSVTRITVKANGKSTRQVLDEVIPRLGCTWKANHNVVTITQAKARGNRIIEGYVHDETGEPLMGVPVCIGETRVCTITDADGYYTFAIPTEKTSLKFTYLGAKPQYVDIVAGTQDVKRNVVITCTNTLNDVVVTGYQDISQPKMTGSAVTLGPTKLDERYTPNIVDNLEGRVAGLSTYGGKLTVRGTSSLYANTTPLLVIDGIPVESEISDLNPQDIESITVLKDAAATAIYGARATNGIIVVKTKNAQKKGKIDIDFSANLTIKEKRNISYKDNWYMNAADQVAIESDYWQKTFNGENAKVPDATTQTMQYLMLGIQVSPINYLYYQKAMGAITQSDLDSQLASLSQNDYAKEYSDKILRQEVQQQYNLALRTSGEKSQQSLTLNYRRDNNGVINSYNQAFNVNYKGIYNFASWLTGTFSINGVYNKEKKTPTDLYNNYSNVYGVPAYYRLFNDDGTTAWANSGFGSSYDYAASDPGLLSMKYNPYDEIYDNTERAHTLHMRYHADLLWRIIDGLTANTQFIYESDNTTDEIYNSPESYTARLMRNAYTVLNADGSYTYLTPKTGGMKRATTTKGDYWTARAQVNYSKTIGRHDFTVLGGLEFRETLINGSKSLMLGYDDLLQNSQTGTVDFGTLRTMRMSPYLYLGQFPAQQYIYNQYFQTAFDPVVEQKHRYASGYANLTYTYANRYNVFASIRKDYADVYGLNAKYRGTPLWSVGGAWNLDQETFMKPVKWINYLKLRLSYGVTGNIYQGATSYMTATSDGTNTITNEPLSTITSPANPNLKWEQTKTTNIGLDFSVLGNRLRGAFDYYLKRGSNIFAVTSLNPTTGYASMVANVADMRNDGVELSLTGDILRSSKTWGVNWDATLTYSYNKNKITRVENPATEAYQIFAGTASGYPFVQGYPTSALFAYNFAGIDNGEAMYYAADGTTKVADGMYLPVDALSYMGQSEPKRIVSLDNTWHCGPFSLSILAVYYGGHKMRALAMDEQFDMPYGAMRSWYANAWTPENTNTDVPGIGLYGASVIGSETTYSSLAVRPADFIKIRNIVFGYELPYSLIHHIGLNRASLRFQIDNPKYLWVKNSVHVDPETLGVRNPASFIFGLNVNI